jgi:hypothetical protein
VTPDAVAVAIDRVADRPELEALVGRSTMGGWRAAVGEALPAERAAGSLLHLLLDDIGPTTVIATFPQVWWESGGNMPSVLRREHERPPAGTCRGFRAGGSALSDPTDTIWIPSLKPSPPLVHPDDPLGWHDMGDVPDHSMRRVRRIDVWVDDDPRIVCVDAGFQDSAGVIGGGRVTLHEYRVAVRADRTSGEVLELTAFPHVLPYVECPSATGEMRTLVGRPLSEMRTVIARTIARTDGCTHLNDTVRALSDVHALVERLD